MNEKNKIFKEKRGPIVIESLNSDQGMIWVNRSENGAWMKKTIKDNFYFPHCFTAPIPASCWQKLKKII